MKKNIIICLILSVSIGLTGCKENENEIVWKMDNLQTRLYIVEPVVPGIVTPQVAWSPPTEGVIIYETSDAKGFFGYIDSKGKEHAAIVDNIPDNIMDWWDNETAMFTFSTVVSRIDIVVNGEVYISNNSYHLKLVSITKSPNHP